jgi:histidine ammonia-lyase
LSADSSLHVFGAEPLTPERLVAIAEGRCAVRVEDGAAFVARLEEGHAIVRRKLASGEGIYGVSTGFGASFENRVGADHAEALAHNLVRYHGCGTGAPFGLVESAAIVAARAASLAHGASGIRWATLKALVALLEHRVLPVIPSEGSVGASGDLSPLSYVAAVLMGEREAYAGYGSSAVVEAHEALAKAGLERWQPAPKETLAIMNATSVMAGLGALALVRAERLATLACRATAMVSEAVEGSRAHFDARIFLAKPHPGSQRAAALVREALGVGLHPAAEGTRLQERYSIRCAPHVIGVLFDALTFAGPIVHTELNGASDNPLVDPESGGVLHGGNFYGGHITFVLDGLKTAVASVAELLERQLVLLLHRPTNGGLPSNLVAVTGDDRSAHHGFKGMEITASALVAEALKLTMPAGSFSRSTEGHNQDKVSMGAIAAREALRILDLAETVASIHLLACAQAMDLRGTTNPLHQRVRALVPTVTTDRRQDLDIRRIVEALREGAL